MPRRETKLEYLKRRFAYHLDRWATPSHKLNEFELRDRMMLCMLDAYECGRIDQRKLTASRHGFRARAKICPTCKNGTDSYAHTEICGL